MTHDRTVLVLGATGGIGGAVATCFAARGFRVRALHRNPDSLPSGRGSSALEWIKGDAMSAADVARAAEGVSVIVHAVNPPGYKDWGKLVLPMLDNTIAAGKANGAQIVLPGTVYNFGPDALPDLHEDSPQHPVTSKGRIRAEMERRLRAAASAQSKVLIVRAGDFFGPDAANNWFSMSLVKPGSPVSKITYPGAAGVGHQWAYIPDAAATIVSLVEKSADLESFAVYHMEGHWDRDGTQMIDAIRKVSGNPAIKVRRLAWPLIRLASPFVPLFRELAEMRYLWQMPVRMRNERLAAFPGAAQHTRLEVAVRTTLLGLGCLAA